MRSKWIAMCAAGMLVAGASAARADSSRGGEFRLPGYGARAWGMAGAVAARISDESSVDWNPAGLGRTTRTAGVAYVELVPESFVTQSQAVFVTPIGSTFDAETGVWRHAAGAMLTHLSFDLGGGATYTENYLRVAYAYSPQPVVTFALSEGLFFSSSDVPGFDAWGTSADMAARVSITKDWSVAGVARNVYSRYSFQDGSDEKIDRTWVFALARSNVMGMDLEADFDYLHSGWLRTNLGAETHYIFGVLALRGGISLISVGEKRQSYSFGASVRTAGRLFVHYGATVDDTDAFDTVHRFSLAVTL